GRARDRGTDRIVDAVAGVVTPSVPELPAPGRRAVADDAGDGPAGGGVRWLAGERVDSGGGARAWLLSAGSCGRRIVDARAWRTSRDHRPDRVVRGYRGTTRVRSGGCERGRERHLARLSPSRSA